MKHLITTIIALTLLTCAKPESVPLANLHRLTLAELISYYYPWFYQAVQDGRIRESRFALMIDRLLMYHDYPQEYGSQISNGALYPVRDSARLDEIRAGAGLGPIAEYLAHFDL